MRHLEGTFAGFGGLNLYYQGWQPAQPARAAIVMVHGLGGHSDLFNVAVQHLAHQYEVYAFDLRGHGRSPGQRGYIQSWAEFREDLRAFLQQVQQQRSSCPFFLWGHSLGGTIVLDYALRSPDSALDGLIVTAPALGKVRVSPVKLTVGRLLSGVHPQFQLKLGIANNLCSRNPAICEAYLQDPLRHEYGTARLATEFFATVNWIYQNASALQTPLLLLHGSADQVTLPEGSQAFFKRVMIADKEYHEYAGNYHDLYVDLDYQGVLTDLENWLDRHLNGDAMCQPLMSYAA